MNMAQNNLSGVGVTFPLTPALSLGERGNPAPSLGMAGAQGSRTLKRRERRAPGATAVAPVLWRFLCRGGKAAQGCRSPKPRGISGAALGSSRRDSLKIARRFNAGTGWQSAASPTGTAEIARPIRPSLRDLNRFSTLPGVETPGYCRSSLWDAAKARN
jgi:hypothetical protein